MELLSIKDLAARWSVSAKRARTIVAALSFPQAIYLTERTRRWRVEEVTAWEVERQSPRQNRAFVKKTGPRGPLPMPAHVKERAA